MQDPNGLLVFISKTHSAYYILSNKIDTYVYVYICINMYTIFDGIKDMLAILNASQFKQNIFRKKSFYALKYIIQDPGCGGGWQGEKLHLTFILKYSS